MKETGPTSREVRDYLNYLTKLKQGIKFPMSLEIDGPLYKVFDGDGNPVVMLTEDLYKVFQEL